jgi:hypothetical protein
MITAMMVRSCLTRKLAAEMMMVAIAKHLTKRLVLRNSRNEE